MDPYTPPKKLLTIEVFTEIIEQYEWPAPYTIENLLPKGIIMRFPKCNLVFVEAFQSTIELDFLVSDTHSPYTLELGHALSVVSPQAERKGKPLVEGLFNDNFPLPSIEKVQHGIHDICKIVLAHLTPCILGDWSWLPKHFEKMGWEWKG